MNLPPATLLYSDVNSLSLRFPSIDSALRFIDGRWGTETVLVSHETGHRVYRDLEAAWKEAEGDSLARPVATLKVIDPETDAELAAGGVALENA